MYGYGDVQQEKLQRPTKKIATKKTGALSISVVVAYDGDDTFYEDELDYRRRKKANRVRRERDDE